MSLYSFLIFLLISGYHCSELVVETPLGSVEGYYGTSHGGRTFLTFEGIPYAKPPLGEKRFEEPEPCEPWNGILKATTSTSCAQMLLIFKIGSEDCLHVNVYVPREEINPEEKLEVVVHIHGGAFLQGWGSSYAKPLYVMDKEVIFVTFNYRLGVFGFLSTEDEVVPGNNGLKDQVLALQWIQRNIASFGGNPDSVTLTGLSAGSTSVHLHYFSQLSNGLFHRGFAQSGTALGPSAVVEGNLDRAQQLADSLDCPTDTSRNLVECLKQESYESILEKTSQFHVYADVPIHPFGPVIEKGGSKSFLTEHPYVSLSKGRVQDLPFITSNTLDEGLLFVEYFSDENINDFDETWEEVAPVLFDFNYTLAETSWKSASNAIKEYYFGNEPITRQKLIQAFNDRYFFYGSDESIKLHANVTKSPVYYFIFGYSGDDNTITTVGHGAETTYMFGNRIPIPLTDNELKMKDLLWDMIVSYAKTDKPTFGDVEWKSTTSSEDNYVQVDGIEADDIRSMSAQQLTDIEFWNSLNFAENDNLL